MSRAIVSVPLRGYVFLNATRFISVANVWVSVPLRGYVFLNPVFVFFNGLSAAGFRPLTGICFSQSCACKPLGAKGSSGGLRR